VTTPRWRQNPALGSHTSPCAQQTILCSKLTAKATLYLNLEVDEIAQHLEDPLRLLQRPRVFALGLPLLLQCGEGGILLNMLRAGGSVVNTTNQVRGTSQQL
jgi:hypothetical protein